MTLAGFALGLKQTDKLPSSKITVEDLLKELTCSKSAYFIPLPVPSVQLYLHLGVGMPAFCWN
jgi:hypothetical protein